jgi:hypothetical protein
MQYQQFYSVQSGTTQPIGGASAYLYEADGETLATIYNAVGTAIDNPAPCDGTGLVGMAAANGNYFLQFTSGAYASPLYPVAFLDPSSLVVTFYTRISSNLTLALGSNYAVDTTAPRILTLPVLAGLADQAVITVADLTGLSQTNNITIQASGSDRINGLVSNPVTVASNRAKVEFVVDQVAGTWQLINLSA